MNLTKFKVEKLIAIFCKAFVSYLFHDNYQKQRYYNYTMMYAFCSGAEETLFVVTNKKCVEGFIQYFNRYEIKNKRYTFHLYTSKYNCKHG